MENATQSDTRSSDLEVSFSSSSQSPPPPTSSARVSRAPFPGAVVRGRRRFTPYQRMRSTDITAPNNTATAGQTSNATLHDGTPSQPPSRRPSQSSSPPRQRPRVSPPPALSATAAPREIGTNCLSFDDCVSAPANGQNGYRYWQNPLALVGVHFRVRPLNYPGRVDTVLMNQLVDVRCPSANFVNTWRYEPGRLIGELDGNVYRIEIRDVTSMFAHVSHLRLRQACHVKPFEIPQDQDADSPYGTQMIMCECCDLSTIYDLSGIIVFKQFLILKDCTNREHWINLAVATDWTNVDLCIASTSRRNDHYRSIRIVDIELPTSTVSHLTQRLRQLARVDTVTLPATTDFAHQNSAAYIFNIVDSFTDAVKVFEVLGSTTSSPDGC